MATNAVVRARIDGRVKDEAAAVLAALGLTVSDAFRLLLVRGGEREGAAVRAAGPEREDRPRDEGRASGKAPPV